MLRRQVMALAVIALTPVSVLRAADVRPVITADRIQSAIHRGQGTLFQGHITGDPPGFKVVYGALQ